MSRFAIQRMPTVKYAVDTTDEMSVKAKHNATSHSEQFSSTAISHDPSKKEKKNPAALHTVHATYVNSAVVNEIFLTTKQIIYLCQYEFHKTIFKIKILFVKRIIIKYVSLIKI